MRPKFVARAIRIGSALLALAACAASCDREAPGATKSAALPAKAYVAWSGKRTCIKESRYELVTNVEAWRRLYLLHLGKDIAAWSEFYNDEGVPEIDFERMNVLAVFGHRVNTAAFDLKEQVVEARTLRLRIEARRYQTMDEFEEADVYGFFVVPSIRQPTVIVEENVQNRIGGEPIWKERARHTSK